MKYVSVRIGLKLWKVWNTETKQVHSQWDTALNSTRTASDLNRYERTLLGYKKLASWKYDKREG